MTKKLSYFLISVLCLLNASCSFMSPVKETTNHYVINTVPGNVPTKRQRAATLLVLAPETSSIYNTPLMAYTSRPYQIAYFGRNEWAATPPEMLQPLLVKTLQDTHHYRAVFAPPYVGRYQYALRTEILTLKQNFICHPAVVEMSVRAQLINNATNRVIATQDFQTSVPMTARNPYCGVVAANQATAQLLQSIAAFCLANS